MCQETIQILLCCDLAIQPRQQPTATHVNEIRSCSNS